MKRFLCFPLAVVLVLTGPRTPAFGEAIVTLKSGTVLRGDIVSDTNDVLQIRAFNANRTISSLRNLPRSDIQNVQIETPAEAAERIDFFALSKFQLDPDQEQSSSFYAQWIAAFERFLKDYPNSDKAAIIQQHLEDCRAELKHIADGEVKFANKWMSPEEKKPQALAKQLAESESQRDALAKTITKLRGELQEGQAHLQRLQDTQQPVYATRFVYRMQGGAPVGAPIGTERYATGQTQAVPNPERPGVLAAIANYQKQISANEVTLSGLNTKIQSLKFEIPQAQSAYEAVLARAKEAALQAAKPPPPPVAAPVVAPPVVVEPSWMAKNGKALAIGGGILLLLLLILAWPFKLLLRKLEQAQAERDEQRRIARANLKNLFDKIFAEGERPSGPNVPEGRIVPIGIGEDSYGGGRWFVIGDSYIWAVQNNGRDEDNWVYNNVTTKGHGAVGARIAMDPEWADAIDTEANAAK